MAIRVAIAVRDTSLDCLGNILPEGCPRGLDVVANVLERRRDALPEILHVAAELLRKTRIRTHALRVNGAGYPAHPLYLPASLKPAPWP